MSTRKRRRGKGQYSKFWVSFIISCNILFTVVVLIAFFKTGMEPSTLIGAWFSFTTVELWQLARIKKEKIKKNFEEDYYNGN